jgi:hypothetical protein
MKIDNDYLKTLLDTCQSSVGPTFNILDFEEAGLDYEDPQFEFHMAILTDKGFIERDDGDPGFGLSKGIDGHLSWSVLPLRLTATGQDFADSIHNSEVWSKTKAAASKVGGVGLDLLVQIAKAEAKRFASEKLGIPLP